MSVRVRWVVDELEAEISDRIDHELLERLELRLARRRFPVCKRNDRFRFSCVGAGDLDEFVRAFASMLFNIKGFALVMIHALVHRNVVSRIVDEAAVYGQLWGEVLCKCPIWVHARFEGLHDRKQARGYFFHELGVPLGVSAIIAPRTAFAFGKFLCHADIAQGVGLGKDDRLPIPINVLFL